MYKNGLSTFILVIPNYDVCHHYGHFEVSHYKCGGGGVHDPVIRAYIFQHLLANVVDIIALHETRCSNSVLQAWVEQWEGLSEWNCGDSKSSGTAFLIRQKLNVHILDRQMDFNGRVLALSLEMDECKFQILNTYAPNPETKAESEDFFMNLQYFFYASLP